MRQNRVNDPVQNQLNEKKPKRRRFIKETSRTSVLLRATLAEQHVPKTAAARQRKRAKSKSRNSLASGH